MSAPRIEQQPPDVLAMVLADTIMVDVAIGKYFIQRLFE
jgi:hypothetical protein